MYTNINLEELTKVLDANLDVPEERFSMRCWRSDCGTAHCLAGNYCLQHSMVLLANLMRPHLFGRDAEKILMNQFRLTRSEVRFLFTWHKDWYWAEKGAKSASRLSKPEALARLAKFLIYKRRKQQLWDDFEAARRHEGNSMLAQINTAEVNELLEKEAKQVEKSGSLATNRHGTVA